MAEPTRPPGGADDLTLLRRFEPILRFTRGEEFFPVDIDWYVRQCSLWVSLPDGRVELLVPEGALTPEGLARPRPTPPGTVYYLVFSGPLHLAELAAFRLHERQRDPAQGFQESLGRLARVGYLSRLVDALFSLSLLLRGRVPGDTAAAAILSYRQYHASGAPPVYYGRVVRENGWIALQYFLFYAYNNWRSGFHGANDHEGDWEMVVVYLYRAADGALRPAWVVCSNHEYPGEELRRPWEGPDAVERDGTHPVIYVGAGSHAGYFHAGEYLAEAELPYLSRLTAGLERLRGLWGRLWGAPAVSGRGPRPPLLRLPFVDYARGDGLAVGPATAHPWRAVLLDPLPGWLTRYRGLWGYYARDPAAGENAPSGPMYNRDGTVRRRWYDPIGWAGLDRLPNPAAEAEILDRRIRALRERQQALDAAIARRGAEVLELGEELLALQDHAHVLARAAAVDTSLRAARADLEALRRERAQNEAVLEALVDRRARLGAPDAARPWGPEPDQRGAGRQPERLSAQDLRLARWLEVWAAISISVLLVAAVALLVWAEPYFGWGLAALASTFVVVEALFRRRLVRLLSLLASGLAGVSAALLVRDFFWPLLVTATLALSLYLLWENVQELRR
jgi:hypothetical protein